MATFTVSFIKNPQIQRTFTFINSYTFITFLMVFLQPFKFFLQFFCRKIDNKNWQSNYIFVVSTKSGRHILKLVQFIENCTNGTKWRKASHTPSKIYILATLQVCGKIPDKEQRNPYFKTLMAAHMQLYYRWTPYQVFFRVLIVMWNFGAHLLAASV